MIPESGKRADVFIQLSPISKEDEQDALRKSLQAPLGPPAPGEPPEPSSEDDDNDLEKILRSDIDRDAEIKEFAKSAGAQLIELRLYIRDSEKRDRLFPAGRGSAVIKGSIEELETLIWSIAAKNDIAITTEQHRTKYEKAELRTLKANVNLIRVSPSLTYSSLYAVVLNINSAFTLFLRGYPLFVDMNRDPLLSLITNVQSMAATKEYICFCSSGATSSRVPSEFLTQEKYLIFDSNLLAELAKMHVIFEIPRHLVSLSVIFATSMFVTIIFYFGLLVFLLPAYAYRTSLVSVLEKCGDQGNKNAISISVALGALPLAIFLVLISKFL